MNFLDYNDLYEFNRMLLATSALTDKDTGCSINSLITLCSSLALGGKSSNHMRTLELCNSVGFLKVRRGKIFLTDFGKEFLKFNPESYYEITEKQKEFIIQKLIFGEYGRTFTRALFLNFRPNFSIVTYEINLVDTLLSNKFNRILYLLKTLVVLDEADGKLIVTPKYVSRVRALLTKGKIASEDELDKALQAERKLGIQAEETILQFEIRRLASLGNKIEAKLVRRISQLNTQAGYDIDSFNAKSDSLQYDRFIEVKAVSPFDYKFNWTKNEIEKAKLYGEKYYLYLLPVIGENKFDLPRLKIIKNPYIRVYKNKKEWNCVAKSFVFSLKVGIKQK